MKRLPDINIPMLDAAKLSAFFWPEFVELDGCVHCAWTAGYKSIQWRMRKPRGTIPDRTISEFGDHVHILDLFDHGWRGVFDRRRGRVRQSHPNIKAARIIGLAAAGSWSAKLALDFPQDTFRVYLIVLDNPILRFHRKYPGEAYVLPPHPEQGKREWPQYITFDVIRGRVVAPRAKPGAPMPRCSFGTVYVGKLNTSK